MFPHRNVVLLALSPLSHAVNVAMHAFSCNPSFPADNLTLIVIQNTYIAIYIMFISHVLDTCMYLTSQLGAGEAEKYCLYPSSNYSIQSYTQRS